MAETTTSPTLDPRGFVARTDALSHQVAGLCAGAALLGDPTLTPDARVHIALDLLHGLASARDTFDALERDAYALTKPLRRSL